MDGIRISNETRLEYFKVRTAPRRFETSPQTSLLMKP